jgi:hypothetical protein
LEVNREFTIEPFKSRKRTFRADKGKKHDYPKQRRRWNLLCHGQTETNLTLNQTSNQVASMDNNRMFKYPPEVRDFWKVTKRKQRAKKKENKGQGKQ